MGRAALGKGVTIKNIFTIYLASTSMKINKQIAILIAVLCGIVAILSFRKSDTETVRQLKAASTPVAKLSEGEKLDKLKREAFRIRGSSFVKSVELNDKKAIINFVSSYSEYKEIVPNTNLTKNDYLGYWESGDAIRKALISGSVGIMKKIDFVDQVQIILPYKKEVYFIDVSKAALEDYLRMSFEDIIDHWDDKFVDPFVYTEKGRRMFFDRFGSVE